MREGWRVAALLGLALAAGPARAGDFPADGVRALADVCRQRPDVPAWAKPAFCGCYVARVQDRLAWADWTRIDAALAAKGKDHLDAEESAILQKAVDAGVYCYQMNVR